MSEGELFTVRNIAGAVSYKPNTACVCGEINMRHCPVHGNGDTIEKVNTSRFQGEYPATWTKQFRDDFRAARGNKCERCKHPHDPANGYALTIHHLDNNKSNCEEWNLAALCQRCHLHIQGKVYMRQEWMGEHSEWMKPHIEGRDKAMRAQGSGVCASNEARGNTYPNTPGFKREGTSKLAAEQAASECDILRDKVLKVLSLGDYTADEIAERLKRSVLSIRPRVSQLFTKGKISDTGLRRKNESGHPATVWRSL